mgnify:CR=1 FL=1
MADQRKQALGRCPVNDQIGILLGNIHVGQCSRIAAGSVVLQDVPRNTTVAGVPARVVGEAGCAQPSISMDQRLDDCDCGRD